MAMVRWNPARELSNMERDLRRMLSSFGSGEDSASMAIWAPPVDIFETDKMDQRVKEENYHRIDSMETLSGPSPCPPG
jgi:HSP20 family molecular chaperone IbpA